MPRQARIDAPGTLHHVISRGIERKEIVKDDYDRQTTIDAVEFIRRFLLHVLPKGFMRIRHYCLFANRCKRENVRKRRELLGLSRELLENESYKPRKFTYPDAESHLYKPYR